MEELNEVLIRFQQGELDAFETLFRRHQRTVYGWVLRLVRNTASAEEITIECFWRIYRAHARFDPRQGFEGWARRVATRAAIDWMRAQKPEWPATAEFFESVAAAPRADPAVNTEIRQTVEAALGRLPPKLRVAAVLTLIEEMPQNEAAAELGISTTALKVRVFRAMRLLRSELETRGIRP